MKKRFYRVLTAFLILLSLFSSVHAEGNFIKGELKREGLPYLSEYPKHQETPGISPVTGLPFEGEYSPVMLVIDNAQNAHPHWGVFDADILYQVPNAGLGATKLMGLYADKLPLAAGGSRSARAPFVDLARTWGAAFAYAGYSPESPGSRLNVSDRLRLGGMKSNSLSFNLLGNQEYASRITGYKAPHNLSANIQMIADYARRSGVSFTKQPFLFSKDMPQGYPIVNQFEVRHYGMSYKPGQDNEASYSAFTYQPQSQTYIRETVNGPYIDRDLPDSPLQFSNVIIQRVRFSNLGQYILLDDMVGTGAADIFIAGQYIKGGWYQQDEDSRTVFVDETGQELALKPGRTFIILTNEVTRINIL